MTYSFSPVEPRDEPLSVSLEGRRLIISIGMDTLTTATISQLNDIYPRGAVRLLNSATFADAICGQLMREGEDGTTLVHRMFDEAANEAIDDGCEGVEMIDQDVHSEFLE